LLVLGMLIILSRVSKLNWLVRMVYSKDLLSGSLLL